MKFGTQLQQLQRVSVKSGAGVLEAIYSKHDSLFADRVMSEADWARHRRATLRHRLEPLDLMKVMLGYMPLLVWVALLSVAIGLYDITLVKWYAWPMLSAECVETFFSSITVALTLLLVFKTNSCYDRWWEARKNVGKLTSWAHNFARQAVSFFPPHEAHLVQALGRWTGASMWVVKSLVRQDSCLKQELRGVLLPEELVWLVAQRHKPLALGQALSTIVAAASISPMVRHQMDAMLTLYTFEFGACNRTYNTAIPTAYTRHTSRFLLCYILFGLPLLLWPMAGWASPILAVVIAFLLLGVENIAAFIEEPFYAIAFDTFATNVQRDVATIVGMWAGSSADRAEPGGPGNNAPVVGGVTAPLTLLPSIASAGDDGDGDDDDGEDGSSGSGSGSEDGDDSSSSGSGGGDDGSSNGDGAGGSGAAGARRRRSRFSSLAARCRGRGGRAAAAGAAATVAASAHHTQQQQLGGGVGASSSSSAAPLLNGAHHHQASEVHLELGASGSVDSQHHHRPGLGGGDASAPSADSLDCRVVIVPPGA